MADRVSVSPITDDMVEAALQAVIALGCGDRDDRCDPGCSCRDIDDKDRADFQLFVRTALEAGLAGCTVVDTPDSEIDIGTRAAWRPQGEIIEAWSDPAGIPLVRHNGSTRVAYLFREVGRSLLAAADRAEQMAATRSAERAAEQSGSQVGDQ